MKLKLSGLILLIGIGTVLISWNYNFYNQGLIPSIDKSYVTFISDAPLEYITATSTMLVGVLDTSTQSFAFRLPMSTFKGFNSQLQKEHFEENYLETKKFPNSQFTGKIIEDVTFTQNRDYTIRAKGGMEIHGITKEQIFKCNLNVKNGNYTISSEFTISLKDYGINIPQLVRDKISDKLKVKLKITMK